MLPSLSIRNYRNLKSLDIEKLARVNLIAGKNNTGKTSLLEAVSLYASGGRLDKIYKILVSRGETDKKIDIQKNYIAAMDCRPLFSERDSELEIKIGQFTDDRTKLSIRLTIAVELKEKKVDPETGKYTEIIKTIIPGKDKLVVSGEKLTDEEGEITPILGLVITHDGKDVVYGDFEGKIQYSINGQSDTFLNNSEFVKSYDRDHEYNSQLWDKIALTNKADFIVGALKIIDSRADKFAFIGGKEVYRKPIVKLENLEQPVPLQSMGEGMNLILSIILSLVNSSNGFLLINEFENGLHHTVQEDLWKMIFKLAKELNVQVFATTHSDDCIHAFERVLNEGNQSEGQYFRLERFGDIIKPIFYSADELEIAAEQNIETR